MAGVGVGRRAGLRAVLLAAGAAAAAACGEDSSSAAGGTSSSRASGGYTGSGAPAGTPTATSSAEESGSTSVPAPTGEAPGGAHLLESRDDLSSPRPQAWDSWRLVDPTTVEVTFWSGSTECYGVHAEVTETERDVTVNLTVGSLPGVSECTAEAVLAATRVSLEKELGDREVRQDAAS